MAFFLVLLLEIAPVVDACSYFQLLIGFWWASQVALVVKNLSASAGHIRDVGWIPEVGRFLGAGHGNPLQYSCLKNPMDRDPHGLQSRGSHRVRHN